MWHLPLNVSLWIVVLARNPHVRFGACSGAFSQGLGIGVPVGGMAQGDQPNPVPVGAQNSVHIFESALPEAAAS
jgi:hypothetical protein